VAIWSGTSVPDQIRARGGKTPGRNIALLDPHSHSRSAVDSHSNAHSGYSTGIPSSTPSLDSHCKATWG
jgi:hypothetical protein